MVIAARSSPQFMAEDPDLPIVRHKHSFVFADFGFERDLERWRAVLETVVQVEASEFCFHDEKSTKNPSWCQQAVIIMPACNAVQFGGALQDAMRDNGKLSDWNWAGLSWPTPRYATASRPIKERASWSGRSWPCRNV